MPRKVFVAGEILTAADVNTNLMDQAVMVFGGTATRGSAIPSPSEGMVTYLEDSNQVQVYDGSAWGAVGKILNVYSAQMSAAQTFSATARVYNDLTDLSITLTPQSASSKFWIFSTFYGAIAVATGESLIGIKVLRDATQVALSENIILATTDTATFSNVSAYVLDAPNTTSSITYKTQGAQVATGSSVTVYVNRNASLADVKANSFLTVMEVAG